MYYIVVIVERKINEHFERSISVSFLTSLSTDRIATETVR